MEEIFKWIVRIFAVIVSLIFLYKFQIFQKSILSMQENLGLLFVGKILHGMGVTK